MRTLHLTLKKKWFDMISSGIKKEEYREIKPYWTRRLWEQWQLFDVIEFRNGYSKSSPIINVECLGICKGFGKVEWGAPENIEVYIIQLGIKL